MLVVGLFEMAALSDSQVRNCWLDRICIVGARVSDLSAAYRKNS